MPAGTPPNTLDTSRPSPNGSEGLLIRTTSDPAHLAEVRLAVESFAERAGFDPMSVGEVGLCVNEAMANITRHAYDGSTDKPIEIAARMESDGRVPANCGTSCLTVTIRDWGKGIDPSKQPRPPRDPERPGGLGLICMQQMMDSAEYTKQPDGMLLTLTKRKSRGPADAPTE